MVKSAVGKSGNAQLTLPRYASRVGCAAGAGKATARRGEIRICSRATGTPGATRGEISDADALASEVRAWSVMGINVFLGLRFGVWGHEDPLVVARHANALLRNGMKA